MKLSVYIILWLNFASCRTYTMLDGKSRPVYFTPDASVFNDSDFQYPSIFYEDLLNVRGNTTNEVELKKGKTVEAIIRQPAFFNAYDIFLVYPGEHIIIKKGKDNNYTFLKRHGSRRRNKELSFFTTFNNIYAYPVPQRTYSLSLDTILTLEEKLKSKIQNSVKKSRQLFDSLAKADRVHKKFKKIAGDYLADRDYVSLYDFYKQNKDTLQASHLYKQKCEQLIPYFNGITKLPVLNGVFVAFNEVAKEVLPYDVSRIKDNAAFRACFDSVDNKFTAIPRDYLLSQLMYAAYKSRIDVDSSYVERYQTTTSNTDLKKLINKVKSQQEQNDAKALTISSNSLLSVDGKTTSALENIMAGNKGKIMLVDFWATWCAPCRDEVPYLNKLMQFYPADKFVLLRISIEKEVQPWQKFIIANNTDISNNYLLINPEKSALIKQYEIDEIPRYMLIGKDEKIMNADAPRPSDPKLKAMLDDLVNK